MLSELLVQLPSLSRICWLQDGNTTINITELPIRKWTQDYKEYLEGLIKPEDKSQKAVLVDYKELHTGANVHFELQTAEGAVAETDEAQMAARFKLTTKINLSGSFYMIPEEFL